MKSKAGNIKVGGALNGMPAMFSQLYLTAAHKDADRFVIRPEYNGVMSIPFKLNHILNFEDNFRYDNVAFVILDKKYKYIAIQEDEELIAYPIDVPMKNPAENLPIYKLGKYEDYVNKLDFNKYAMLECAVMDPDNENKILGTFLFKTKSKNSINEITSVLSQLNSVESKDYLRYLTLNLTLHSKLYMKGQIKHIHYCKIDMPSLFDIKDAIDFAKENTELSSILEQMEKTDKEERKKAKNEALDIKSITIEKDIDIFGDEFIFESKEDVEAKKKEDMILEDVPKLRESYPQLEKLSDNILKTFLDKCGGLEKAGEVLSRYISQNGQFNTDIDMIQLMKTL